MLNIPLISRSVLFCCFFSCSNIELHSTEIVESSFHSYKNIWKSNNQEEIIPLIQEQLKNQNEKNNYPVFLSFDEENEFNKEILNRNRYIKDYNNRTIVLSVLNKDNIAEQVGHIDITLQKRTDYWFERSEKEFLEGQKENSKVAHINWVEIYPQHQGKGYGSFTLKIAHDFLDKIGTHFSFLENTSTEPYSGIMYKKAGYFCAPNLLKDIIDWGEEKGIAADQAENEFWKDASEKLKLKNPRRLHMIRYNPNKSK